LHRSLQFAKDPKAIAGGHPVQGAGGGQRPDFRTISDFRKNHLAALQGLFEQVLEMALEAGAMKLGRVSLDGTKVKGNASKHKAMSYGRMNEKQQQLTDPCRPGWPPWLQSCKASMHRRRWSPRCG
jgi:hypothetical protein